MILSAPTGLGIIIWSFRKPAWREEGDRNQLLLSDIELHRPVSTATVTSWVKGVLGLAGHGRQRGYSIHQKWSQHLLLSPQLNKKKPLTSSLYKPKFSVSPLLQFLWIFPGAPLLKGGVCHIGIYISIFKAHSVRAASTSKAKLMGLSTKDILKRGNLSSESTWQEYYRRHIVSYSEHFQEKVLQRETL